MIRHATVPLPQSDVSVDVEYTYSPEEPMVMYYADGSGYPGCAAEIEIRSIFFSGNDAKTDVFELIEALDWLEYIEEHILENESYEE
jgi:hypothetical protein